MSATIPAIRTELWCVNYQDLNDSGVNFCKVKFRLTMEYLDRIRNEHFLHAPSEKPCRPIYNRIDQLQGIPDGHTRTNENVFINYDDNPIKLGEIILRVSLLKAGKVRKQRQRGATFSGGGRILVGRKILCCTTWVLKQILQGGHIHPKPRDRNIIGNIWNRTTMSHP